MPEITFLLLVVVAWLGFLRVWGGGRRVLRGARWRRRKRGSEQTAAEEVNTKGGPGGDNGTQQQTARAVRCVRPARTHRAEVEAENGRRQQPRGQRTGDGISAHADLGDRRDLARD